MKSLQLSAQETIKALETQQYVNQLGNTVDIFSELTNSIANSTLYNPNSTFDLSNIKHNHNPNITVTQETTLEAAKRFAPDVCVLNFASAHHPGGAWVEGAIAQEESIARASGLYPTLIAGNNIEMYSVHENYENNLYENYAIYSPKVPVFKHDDGNWLDVPYLIDVVTSPAPNCSLCNEQELQLLPEVFRTRMRQVLSIMAENYCRNIILGAWGCGVFGNDPALISKMFKDILLEMPYYDNIVFAIYANKTKPVFYEFENIFTKV